MSGASGSWGEGQEQTGKSNSRQGSTQTVKKPPEALLFVRPETSELVVCPPESAVIVLQEMADVSKFIDDLLTAWVSVADLQEKLDAATSRSEREQIMMQLKAALDQEKAARKTVEAETKKIPSFNKTSALWEMLPLAGGPDSKLKGKKFTYVRSDKMKDHLRGYKLGKDAKPKMKSFMTMDDNKKWKLDDKKLKEAFGQIAPQIKMYDVDIWKTSAEWSPDFLSGFNHAEYKSPDDPDGNHEFSAEATLFRAFAGTSGSFGVQAGSESISDALSGKGKFKAAFKVKGEAGVKLGEAKAEFKFWVPNKRGWNLCLPDSLGDRSLGFFKFELSAEVSGSCGASIFAEGGLELTISSDKKQGVKGSPAGRTAQGVAAPKLNIKETNEAGPGGDFGGDIAAFAGAQAEAKLGGSFKWQKPEKHDFADFASIEPQASAQAGIGAAAAFHITYEGGKYRIYCKAGVCVGVGVKGSIEAAVGAQQMAEFVLWTKHQIYLAVDKNIKIFEKEAFEVFLRMSILAILENKPIATYLGKTFQSLDDAVKEVQNGKPEVIIARLGSRSPEILNSLAPVKGYLLKLLQNYKQQQSTVDEPEIQLPSPGSLIPKLPGSGLMQQIDDSIRNLIRAGQLMNEIKNMFQFSSNTIGMKQDESQVQVAMSDPVVVHELAALDIRGIKPEPTPGYALAWNDSHKYALQSGTHPAWNPDAWWVDRTQTG